jgi:hypothetical protein
MFGDIVSTEITVPVIARLVREHRRHCPSCGLRRVLYAIEVAPDPGRLTVLFGRTIARCANCMGIREPR